MVGACGTGAEDALPGQKRRRKTSLPTRQTGKFMGAGVHDLLDGSRDPLVRSLESAAIRTLRPCAHNEMEKKRKRADIESAALKTKHAHWTMPVETYEALLAPYCCTSEHWSFSHMTKQARVWPGKCQEQNLLPCSYFTVKSKCYKAEGRGV